MNLENKKPVSSPKQLVNEKGELKPLKNIFGAPLNYRFNASGQGGILNFEGLDNANLTKAGHPFTLCPIGFRAFNAMKFGREKAQIWIEIFFLNEKGNACSVMFHSSSAENFLTTSKLLAYDDLTIADIKLCVTPQAKQNKDGNAYFICKFDIEELTEEERKIQAVIVEEIGTIYRRDTIDNSDQFIASYNFPPNLEMACQVYVPQLESTEQREVQLLDDFEGNPKGVRRAA